MLKKLIAFFLLMIIPVSIAAHRLHGAADGDKPATQSYNWKALDKIIGAKGTLHDDVYTLSLPRIDLNVTVDGMDVPAAAGVASEFHFFRCTCGKMRLVGQFCCTEYEANDVIDALRVGAAMQVAGSGPMFLGDKPKLTIVRFQGEGDAETMAKVVKSALDWTGEARNASLPVKK